MSIAFVPDDIYIVQGLIIMIQCDPIRIKNNILFQSQTLKHMVWPYFICILHSIALKPIICSSIKKIKMSCKISFKLPWDKPKILEIKINIITVINDSIPHISPNSHAMRQPEKKTTTKIPKVQNSYQLILIIKSSHSNDKFTQLYSLQN